MPDELPAPAGEFLLYQTEDGRSRVECRLEDETLWLSQALMAELFDTSPQNITLHLKSLYEDGEIAEAATCKEFLQVRQEGSRTVRREVFGMNAGTGSLSVASTHQPGRTRTGATEMVRRDNFLPILADLPSAGSEDPGLRA